MCDLRRRLVAILLPFACCGAPTGLVRSAESHSAAVPLADIVDNVRRNEKLYNDIDVSVVESYDLGGREPEEFLDGSFEVVRKDIRTKYVAQRDLFRLDISGRNLGATAEVAADRIRAFDGKLTRSYSQQAIGNIVTGRKTDTQSVRPHMLLLRFMGLDVPLSAYLGGDEAINSFPESGWPVDQRLALTYNGQSVVGGLQCHVVHALVYLRDQPAARWELWLAEERNYIPARLSGFDLLRRSEHMDRSAEVTEWKEVRQGVWFPMDAHVLAYDVSSEAAIKLRGLIGAPDTQLKMCRWIPNMTLVFLEM